MLLVEGGATSNGGRGDDQQLLNDQCTDYSRLAMLEAECSPRGIQVISKNNYCWLEQHDRRQWLLCIGNVPSMFDSETI